MRERSSRKTPTDRARQRGTGAEPVRLSDLLADDSDHNAPTQASAPDATPFHERGSFGVTGRPRTAGANSRRTGRTTRRTSSEHPHPDERAGERTSDAPARTSTNRSGAAPRPWREQTSAWLTPAESVTDAASGEPSLTVPRSTDGRSRQDASTSPAGSPRGSPPSDGDSSAARPLGATGSITAIERQETRLRFNVFVDGMFAVALDPEIIVAQGVRVGLAITVERLRALADADLRKHALDGAFRLLAARPRSESEVRDRLGRRELPPEVIDATIERLRELGYVDDAAFASFWVESRSGANPRGRYAVQRELQSKGVDHDTAETAMEPLEDAAAALRAGAKKARTLTKLEYQQFRTRLSGYLLRRGFGYAVVRDVVNHLWRESHGTSPEVVDRASFTDGAAIDQPGEA